MAHTATTSASDGGDEGLVMMGTMVVMVMVMMGMRADADDGDADDRETIGRRYPTPLSPAPPAPPPAFQKVHRLVVPVAPTRVPRFGTRVGEGKG